MQGAQSANELQSATQMTKARHGSNRELSHTDRSTVMLTAAPLHLT
jgi:hypothetical protein